MTTLAGLAPTDKIRVGPGAAPGPLVTADGVPLAKKLAIATRRAKLRAFMLVLPILLFVIAFFVLPIGQMLRLSLADKVIRADMPNTTTLLSRWDGKGLPDEAVFAAAVIDLKTARERQAAGRVGSQMNHVYSGARSAVVATARSAASLQAPFKKSMIEANEVWGDTKFWVAMKSLAAVPTGIHYLNALDLTLGEGSTIKAQPENLQIHVTIFWRTLWLSMVVTVLCMLLGFPVAFLLSQLPMRISNLLMICVLLPFWTALLVRITAWMAILQSDGVILASLASLGLVAMDTGARPQLVYNLTGTLIAMVHVLLPSMILPIYSVMRTIPPSYVRAARSLGATSFTAFWRVYFPQTLPGIAAGGLLVFILSVGYYITPALLGGQSGVLISNFIALHTETTLNWGLAGALGGLLLAATLVLYWLFNKIVGIERLKMG
jgi:putative spermidine/putrescine transport system permease protein